MKKGMSLLIACAMLMGMSPAVSAETVSAADVMDNVVTPRYLYTRSASAELDITSGVATLISKIEGISGTTTKIEITQTLQMKDGNQWRRCTSWTKTYNTYRCTFINTYTPSSNATFRNMTEAKVYSGSNYETIYCYSN